MLRVSVLGPVEASRDGKPLPLPGGKTSELLVRLAIDAGVRVRTDRLIEDLWGDDAVHTGRNTLQAKVSQLRRALQQPDAVVSGDGGYQLAVEAADVDALTLPGRSLTAARLLDGGDASGAVDLCRTTLALYRGEILAGAGEWAAPHRARLEAEQLTLLEIELRAELALGDPGTVADAEAAVARHPYQETLWILLVKALYQAGRTADALAAHHRVRNLLADDLGLLPGPELTALEHQLLTHDPALLPTRSQPSPPAPAGAPPGTGNLPSLANELIGRDREVVELCDLLANDRLVEIVGPGGVGKTALAIATGRTLRPPGGVWLACLETATNGDEVVDTLVAALNVTGGESALVERLRAADLLVILDNCEHVLDAVADLASGLLDAAPGLRLLCTTQAPLGLDGETLLELAPLALDHAVELFGQRAGRQRARRRTADTDDAVRGLCDALDGLPLAIELAAARTRTLTVDEISRRLDDRFAVLRDPTSRRPERRRALGATLQWSYDLLFPDDQRGLWALAAFPGGATLDAVESVLAALDVPASAAIDIVSRLASRSLLVVDDHDDSAPPRYRLLDSIRAFALGAMASADLTTTAFEAHSRWYAATAACSTERVRGPDQQDHLRLARTERANIDAALAWSAAHEPTRALAIAIGFGWAWVVLGDSRGAQRLLAALDACGDAAEPADRATALLLAGWIEASTGDLAPARTHLAAAALLADELDDDDLRARGAYYLAYVVSHDGDFRAALELTDRSRTMYDRLDRPWDQAANALFATRAAISAGDAPRAAREMACVQRWLTEVEDPWLHVRRDAMLGELARLERRFGDAVGHLARASDTSQRLGFRQTEAYQLASLGRAQAQAGDDAMGARTLEVAVGKAEAIGDMRMAALARVHLGRVRRALGDADGARAALEAADAWHRRAGGGEQARLGACLLAALDAADGEPGAAERLRAVLAEAQRHDQPHVEVFALDALARLAAADGADVQAAALWAEADARMRSADHFITERDRVDRPEGVG